MVFVSKSSWLAVLCSIKELVQCERQVPRSQRLRDVYKFSCVSCDAMKISHGNIFTDYLVLVVNQQIFFHPTVILSVFN